MTALAKSCCPTSEAIEKTQKDLNPDLSAMIKAVKHPVVFKNAGFVTYLSSIVENKTSFLITLPLLFYCLLCLTSWRNEFW